MNKIKDFLLGILETYSGKIYGWCWDKRWKRQKLGEAYQKVLRNFKWHK